MNELSAGALRLYLFLAQCRNTKTGKCCPSVEITAEAIGVHKRNVFRLRNELAEAEWARFDGDNVTDLLGSASGKNTTKNVESVEDIPIKEETGKNATTHTVSTGKNATKHWQKRHQKVAKMPVACKEELYEGTRRIELDEVSGANAPAGGLSSKECYALFAELRTTVGGYEVPYQNSPGDFVQLAKLFKTCAGANWVLTGSRFRQAAQNYFLTPRSSHTLADLAAHFSDFYKHPLDRYGKPVQENGNGRTQIPRNETHNERVGREMEELFRYSAAAHAEANGNNGADSGDASTPWLAADYTRL